jgi:hypothetical protein
MSIDTYIWVTNGARHTYKDDHGSTWATYKSPAELSDNQKTPHQVFLAHQGLDEQFVFEDALDAVWFWTTGYQGCLIVNQDGNILMHDRMTLWVDSMEVATRGSGGMDQSYVHSTEEPVATSPDSVHEEEGGMWDVE